MSLGSEAANDANRTQRLYFNEILQLSESHPTEPSHAEPRERDDQSVLAETLGKAKCYAKKAEDAKEAAEKAAEEAAEKAAEKAARTVQSEFSKLLEDEKNAASNKEARARHERLPYSTISKKVSELFADMSQTAVRLFYLKFCPLDKHNIPGL
jgi:hypothetical protein